MDFSIWQWELILQGLVNRREKMTDILDPNGRKFKIAHESLHDTWRKIRDQCQDAIDKICAQYPAAERMYYDDNWDWTPLEKNY